MFIKKIKNMILLNEQDVQLEDISFELDEFENDSDLDELLSLKPKGFGKEKDMKMNLDVFVDSEFKDIFPVSFQFIVKGTFKLPKVVDNKFILEEIVIFEKIIVLESFFEDKLNKKDLEEWSIKNNVNIYFKPLFTDKVDYFLISILLNLLYEKYNFSNVKSEDVKLNLNYWFYFSPKDISIPLGPENIRKQYLLKNNKISQFRSMMGSFNLLNNDFMHSFKINIKLKDLSGLDKSGLSEMAKSYGLSIEKSMELDNYKLCMDKALLERTLQFLDYGLKDVEILLGLSINIVESFNLMLIEVFNIKNSKYLYTTSNIPTTLGTLVCSMFMKYIDVILFKENNSLKLSIFSKSILNTMSKTYKKNLEVLKKLKSFNSISELDDFFISNKNEYNSLLTIFSSLKNFKYLPWQYCSTKYLLDNSTLLNLRPLASVSGGRVINERPEECYIEKAVDVDIVSAYGSILQDIIYPLGRPRILAYTPNQENRMSLGDFFKKYETNLKTGLYKITVNGMLSFEQDILFSRYIKDNLFEKRATYLDPDDPSTFRHADNLVLLRKELKESIITAPLWHIIKTVSTNKEFSEIKQLKISSAVFYLDSDRVFTLEELGDKFLKDKEDLVFSTESTSINDFRSFKWYGIDLKPIILPVLQKRQELKKLQENLALQNALKLWVNTMYGVICSIYFSVNNVLVGDIITSSIRANVWLMAKALNLHITVCDGGPFSLKNVTFFKENSRKPGLHIFSYYYRYKKYRYFKFGSLANYNWDNLIDNFKDNSIKINDIANLVNDHITKFWKNYNLEIKFKVEIKHLILKGSYLLKSHYLFKIWDSKLNNWCNDYYYKIRGFKYQKDNQFLNPIYYLLIYLTEKGSLNLNNDIYNTPWIPVNNGIYNISKILKINSWKKSLEKNKYSIYGVDYLPGDMVWEERDFRVNNTHFPFYTLSDYLRKTRRSYKIYKDSNSNNIRMKLFERYLEKYGIRKMLIQMSLDELTKISNKD